MSLLVAIDNETGQLNAPVGSGDPTIPLNAAWAGPTVATPYYVRIVLDPPLIGMRNALYEVTYCTVVNGSATATVVQRGAEGTTPVAHASGANWCCGPAAFDFGVTAAGIYFANVRMSSTQPDTAGAYATLHLNTVVEDAAAAYNPTLFVYTARVAGVYRVTASVVSEIFTAGDRSLALFRGASSLGSLYRELDLRTSQATTGNTRLNGTTSIRCAVNDWLSIAYFSPGATAGAIANGYADFRYLCA